MISGFETCISVQLVLYSSTLVSKLLPSRREEKKKGTQVSRNITTNDVTKSLNAYKIEKIFCCCPILVLFDVENDGETDF